MGSDGFEGFNFWKLIAGFFPVSSKNTAKLIWVGCLIALGLYIDHKFFSKPTNNISGGIVTINQTKPVVKIIQVWRIMIAWEK